MTWGMDRRTDGYVDLRTEGVPGSGQKTVTWKEDENMYEENPEHYWVT